MKQLTATLQSAALFAIEAMFLKTVFDLVSTLDKHSDVPMD